MEPTGGVEPGLRRRTEGNHPPFGKGKNCYFSESLKMWGATGPAFFSKGGVNSDTTSWKSIIYSGCRLHTIPFVDMLAADTDQ